MTNYGQSTARLMLAFMAIFGLLALGTTLISDELEWRFVAMAALALFASRQSAQIRTPDDETAIHIPFTHPVLFASSLALGPFGCALPGAFCGIGYLLSGGPSRRTVTDLIYAVMKPAAICTCASIAYTSTGGSVLNPQSSNSLLPALIAACTYITANTVLIGIKDTPSDLDSTDIPNAAVILSGWFNSILAGYALAALYAFAPSYLLFAPTAAIGFMRIALHKSQANERPEAEQKASEDAMEFVDRLTGLANQRYLKIFLHKELNRASRSNSHLTAVLFELTGFEKFAEGKARKTAEKTLIEMGEHLKSQLREYDLVARYAAGRLIIIMPGAPMHEACEVAERLHKSLSILKLGRKPVSITAGIASFPQDGATVEDLINSCHRALNRGKFEGENKVYSVERLARAG